MSPSNAICSPHAIQQSRTGSCFLSALVLLVLAGCSHSPPSQPEAPIMALQSQFSASGSVQTDRHWWKSFNDAQLNAWIEEAFQNNLTLAQAWGRLRLAETTLASSSASRFPSLSVVGGVRQEWQESSDGDRRSDRSSGSLGLNASYELDLWGRVRARDRSAYFDYLATEQDLQAAAVTMAGQIALTWYNLVERHAQRALLEAQYQTAEQTLESIRIRFQHGSRNATDLLQQQQVIEARRGALILNQSEIEVLEHALAVLLGKDPSTASFESPIQLPELPPFPSTGLPAALLTARPDIQAAWMRIQASDAEVAAAIANRFPTLTLGGVVSSAFASPVQLFDNWIQALTANVSASLFDGGLRRAAVERQRAVVGNAILDYQRSFLGALREVEDAIIQERQQQAFLDSLSRQIELAEQVFSQTLNRYQRGDQSYLQVLTAQDSLHALRRSELTARRALVQNRIALYRALAGGFALEPSQAWNEALPSQS